MNVNAGAKKLAEVSAGDWEVGDDGLLSCNRHTDAPRWKPGRGYCTGCKTDPGKIKLDVEDLAAPIKAPRGCLSMQQIEAHLVSIVKEIEDGARVLMSGKGKGRINKATAFRGFEVAIKGWERIVAMASQRERVEYNAKLQRLKRARERRGRAGGSN